MVLLRNAYFPGRVPPGAWVTGAPVVAAQAAAPHEAGFVADLDAFLARHKMSASRFGYLIGRPATFVGDVREGMKIKPATEQRLREFIRRYDARPDGEWRRGSGMLK